MARPEASKRWHVFAVQCLPVQFAELYQVQATIDPTPVHPEGKFRGVVGLAQAVTLRDRLGAALVCILAPDGRVARIGSGCDRAPTGLRGSLVRRNEGDFVRLTAPAA
jgi:hypothetical protein